MKNRTFTLSSLLMLVLCSNNYLNSQTLVINEIDYDQTGSDTSEFIELYNTGSQPVSLANICVELFNGGTSTIYQTISLPAVDLAAGGYFVICGRSLGCSQCNYLISPGNLTAWFQNGPDGVILRNCSGAVIDQLCYEGSLSTCEGTPTSAVDLGTVLFATLSRFPDGMDTDNNDNDFIYTCSTPGEANVSTTPGSCPDPFLVCPPSPTVQVQLADGALYIEDGNAGILLKGQNGLCYKIVVDVSGNLIHQAVICPQ